MGLPRELVCTWTVNRLPFSRYVAIHNVAVSDERNDVGVLFYVHRSCISDSTRCLHRVDCTADSILHVTPEIQTGNAVFAVEV